MLPTHPGMLSSSPRPSRLVTPVYVLNLLALSGCASTPSAVPPPTVLCPRPAPLPQAVLRIDLQPSTSSLSRASAWLERSEAILNDETPK